MLFYRKFLSTSHIDNFVFKAKKNLGLLLWEARRFPTVDTLLKLYKTTVIPVLQYCFTLWYYNRDCITNKIEAVKRRLLFGSALRGFYERSPSNENCRTLDIFTSLKRRFAYNIMFINKMFHRF